MPAVCLRPDDRTGAVATAAGTNSGASTVMPVLMQASWKGKLRQIGSNTDVLLCDALQAVIYVCTLSTDLISYKRAGRRFFRTETVPSCGHAPDSFLRMSRNSRTLLRPSLIQALATAGWLVVISNIEYNLCRW